MARREQCVHGVNAAYESVFRRTRLAERAAIARTRARSIHTAVDFFNQINMLYGTITEFCTPNDCKVMSAGAKYVPAVLHSVDWTCVCKVDRWCARAWRVRVSGTSTTGRTACSSRSPCACRRPSTWTTS